MMTDFLSIRDLSKKLHVPKSTVYLLAQQKKIPGAFKFGRHWRFRRDMIEAWIDEQTKPQVAAQDVPK